MKKKKGTFKLHGKIVAISLFCTGEISPKKEIQNSKQK
jgi:hypothetical protein